MKIRLTVRFWKLATLLCVLAIVGLLAHNLVRYLAGDACGIDGNTWLALALVVVARICFWKIGG